MSLDDFLKLISELSKAPIETIKENTSIRDDLGIDSLQLVNLIVHLTERFGVNTSKITSMEDIQTVGKMYRTLTGGE
jgi:acyl carrier protein